MEPKKQRLVAVILGVLVVIIWVRGLTVKPNRSHRGASPALSRSIARDLQTTKQISQPAVSRFTDWGGNPFEVERRSNSPTPQPGASPSSYVLSGILWDSKSPSAIINGRLVGVGDPVGQWKVVEIHKDRVILSDGLTTHVMTLK